MPQALPNLALDIVSLHSAYRRNELTPESVVDIILEQCDQFESHNVWIARLTKTQIQPYLDYLVNKSIDELPLYGVPFAIKDNIDLYGVDTTAGCEAFRYQPSESAFLVTQLINAGAIPIGKTNLDQFATGLVGTRSPEPWGPCKNSIDPSTISGGSSSGSAVAVALGLVSFALGTDTAGSGRVPAMLNNIVGHKPSRGLFSMTGVVPACRSLDCPSVFALTAADAKRVFDVGSTFDSSDSYARENPYNNSARHWGLFDEAPTIGVPLARNLTFFGNQETESLFWQSIEQWRTMGATLVEIDIAPLLDAARLLYEGPWVAERYAAIESLLLEKPEEIHAVVREIVLNAEGKTAVETFQYEYQMQAYRRIAQRMFDQFDFLISPTAPTTYTIDELLENPIELNSNMGYYTNYMNLLDLAGTAVPAGMQTDGRPFGITLIAPAMHDQRLLSYAHQWQFANDHPCGARGHTPKWEIAKTVCDNRMVRVAVCGAHLEGMPLNWQLTERGGVLQEATKTSADYQLYALPGGPPFRPGLKRVDNGCQIEIEVWAMPTENFGSFVSNIPAPLGIGKVETEDGEWLPSFICESYGFEGAQNISSFKGWRAYMDSLTVP